MAQCMVYQISQSLFYFLYTCAINSAVSLGFRRFGGGPINSYEQHVAYVEATEQIRNPDP